MNLQKIKNIGKRIFFLPPFPTLLIAIPSYALVIYALTSETVNRAIAYAAYLLSAYAFVITITGITGVVRLIQKGVKQNPITRKVLEIPLVGRYLKEDTFRAQIALYQGFFINLFYVGVKMFSGIRYKSVWFVSLAVYYILLAIMRFSLLHHERKRAGKSKASEWRRYRLCGIMLLFMNVALTGIIILVVSQNSGFEYPGMLIYIMALYAFYAVITAVWNVIKFRRYGSPILSAAKVINLTAALVSMLSLETAMLTQFGTGDDAEFRKIMTASTGAGVCIIVTGMSVYMIVHATTRLRNTERNGCI
ncbi:MAG: hypothetical protein K2N89_13725 [Lachnospiraceae bacterium]|nr:hypothetical protein [Lachnospiraceae bacterium]